MKNTNDQGSHVRKGLMLALLTGLTVTGCTTPTVMHYDLTNTSSSATLASKSTMTTYLIDSVNVPEPLDVMTLIVRQPNNSLMALSHDKWVAPLGQVLREAIADGLTQNLGVPPVSEKMLTADSSGTRSRATQVTKVNVDIRQFEMQPGKKVALTALWQVAIASPARTTITCYSQLSTPVESGVAPLVAAQKANIGQLSQQIARVIATSNPVTDARCRVLTSS